MELALRHPLFADVQCGAVTPGAPTTSASPTGTDLAAFAERLGHSFADPSILAEALTHPSALEGRPGQDYDRLEFLGDRVLGLIIATELYRRFPQALAGELSRRFNALVRSETLAEIAGALELGSLLRLSPGERQAGGGTRRANLENACEALVAALYLDGGYEAARRFVLDRWAPYFERERAAEKDPKTALQEWAHVVGRGMPQYRIDGREGPDHLPLFRVAVEVAGLAPAVGEGRSKREAEQAAAGAMLAREAGTR
jgi:ribonuclease-3